MGPIHPGETEPLWLVGNPLADSRRLGTDLVADVCVVGGGIAGLTTAYLLMKEGKSVCLLEDFEVASGQTGRSTAQLVTGLDETYQKLEKYHGTEALKFIAESHVSAIQKVIQIIRHEKIDCDMQVVDGYMLAGVGQKTDVLQKELEAAHRAGLTTVELHESSPVPTWDSRQSLRFPGQLQINPYKYLTALAEKFIQQGGRLYTQTRVVDVVGGMDAFVKTQDGVRVSCDAVVVATNSPMNDLFALHTKQAPYRTYVVGLKIPKKEIPLGLFWDTQDPFHYVRLQQAGPNDDFDILLVGGEDHKTGQDADPEVHFENLVRWAREKFPTAGEVAHQWSGQVMISVDGLAFLGHNPMDRDNVYVITGDSGNGMTHSTIGAMLITDQILKRPNPWEAIYNPSRVSLRATPRFLRENANVAAQYLDWITPKDNPDITELPPGHGTVIRDGVSLVAVYKDEEGQIDLMSASCPHLAGVVSWNKAERSWDCPCHGSRFDGHGKVIAGPACTDLKKYGVPDEPVMTPYKSDVQPSFSNQNEPSPI